MIKLHIIGPLDKLEKIITDKMDRLLIESKLNYIKDRYELTVQALQIFSKDSEMQGLYTDIVNSLNGNDIGQDLSMIIPSIIQDFFCELESIHKTIPMS